MAVTSVALAEEECYLLALIQDHSGIDLAEFLWEDPTADNEEKIFRAWGYQIPWWRRTARLFIDACARAVGKTMSIILRAWAFPIQFPGYEMVLTAPELIHLNPLTSRVEDRIKEIRLTRELLPGGVGRGFTHRPFQANFVNGAKILGRIPQKDGKGVKGCVVEGTLILTERGHIPVEDLRVGDRVATHRGGWQPVEAIYTDINDCFEVRGSQSHPLRVSCDHSFYGASNQATPKQKRRFTELAWWDVENLDSVYWASPRRFDGLPIPQPVFRGTARRFDLDEDFWWLTGRYLADGFVSRDRKTGKARKVSWVVHPDEAVEVEKRLDLLGLPSRRIERSHSSADVVEVASAPWERWLVEYFGHRANNKRLPGFVLGMNELHREALLEGYLSGDGHYNQQKSRWEFGSASRALVNGLQLLGQTLGYVAVASQVQPTSQFTDKAQISWRAYLSVNGHPHTIDDMSVAKVKSVTPIGKQRIYNPIVANDHSYVTGTIVSHNLHPLRLEMDECFPTGTLILTDEGFLPIQDVAVGDRVLTHRGRWRSVTKVFDRGIRPAVEVRGQGHPGLIATPNHKFYAQGGQRWRSGGSGWEWIEAKSLVGNYWSSPRHVPELSVPEIPLARTNAKRPIDPSDITFLELMGWWIAEGSASSATGGGPLNRAWWSVHSDEESEITNRLDKLGLRYGVTSLSRNATNIVVRHSPLARWLVRECGKGAKSKEIPVWVLGMSEVQRRAVLDTIIDGDGFRDRDDRYVPGRWKVSTTSKALAFSLRLLAQSLGYYVSVYWNDLSDRKATIAGRPVRSEGFYQIVGNQQGQGLDDGDLRLTKVRAIEEVEPARMYDLEVADDHSFVAEGIVVHNSQDYPEPGWTELIETLRYGQEEAQWRAHGVSRGVGGRFQKVSSPGSGWEVQRITAIHRTDWSEQERSDKIALYGGRDSPDYLRNILGLHGDATNPLFVLHRLMACVDDDEGSFYNQDIYYKRRINDEMTADIDILSLIDPPRIHTQDWKIFWMGMDVGLTNHPSEILVFGEENLKIPKLESRVALRLLTRINMRRIRAADQRRVVTHLIGFYKPRKFAMDRTGLGHPVYQDLQDENPELMSVIEGYAFNEKLVVGHEDYEEGDKPEDHEIKRVAQEHAYDLLRTYVDGRRLILPFDTELLGEWNGQTWIQQTAATRDAYGKKRFAQGEFHTLDAGGMAVLAKEMAAFAKVQEMTEDAEPIGVVFA